MKLERIKEEIATLRAALILDAASGISIAGWLFSNYDTTDSARLWTAIYALLIVIVAGSVVIRFLFRGLQKLENSDDLDPDRRNH
ncbi:hypothetical protein [Salinisphaera japonica]|uniref:Uncharacterized protein n=1 Tax=Salinisphaera japonica YTM-1 TaxID=1209778 RepID=A0A423PE53_9GAMM|nr:hypothetical protein [Salinisphaera japonica]ROO23855.1 hypothetical protein SAJA_14970 [Salinisphaera japonica YTM-1]